MRYFNVSGRQRALKLAVLLLALLTAEPALASGFAALFAENTDWQKIFAGAPRWSTLGVKDDNGVTDNNAALNALPAIPIVGDCPHGGFVFWNKSWNWISGHAIWYDNGCKLVYGNVTPGVYPITQSGALHATSPITGIKDYNLQISAYQQVQGVRIMQVWADHLDMKHFDINGTGGGFFNRGSDQLYELGTIRNTINRAGNPGWRLTSNFPKVPTSPGLHDNVNIRHVYAQTGDGTFQACQVTGPDPTFFTYNNDTDGVTYEDSYAAGASAILAGLESTGAKSYFCKNISFKNIRAGGRLAAIIVPGGAFSYTDNILVDTLFFDGGDSTSGLGSVGVGNIQRGPFHFTGQMGKVTLRNIVVINPLAQALEVKGGRDFTLQNASFEAPGRHAFPTAIISGLSKGVLTNVSVDVGLGGGLQIGADGVGTNLTGTGIAITGVVDGQSGLHLSGDVNINFTSGSVVAAPGAKTATGVYLDSDPGGAHGAHVSGFNLTGVPIPMHCAPGQGNIVVSNPGAADCSP